MTKARELSCAFCGKTRAERPKMVAGPLSGICDACLRLCNDIIGPTPSEQVAKLMTLLSTPPSVAHAAALTHAEALLRELRGLGF